MATIPAASYISNAARTEGEVKQALEDTIASLRQVPGSAQVPLTNTIASGSITPAGSGGMIVIDTEASAATDDLTNIVTTNYPDGSMLLIRNSNAARFVVVKHLAGGAGQMNLDRSVDYTLDDTKKFLMLQRNGADWYEVFRAPQQRVPAENPIINGSMDIWQRGTAFTSPSNNAYTADRWQWGNTSAAVVTINQSTNVPTVAQAGVLLNYSLEVDLTTADASIAAGDYAYVSQKIEGSSWRQFAQRAFTLSFWVWSSKTGTHCVACRNAATADRTYIGTYTINSASTWEYKTITVTASPSAGTWNYTTGTGLEVSFVLACGSTFQTTAGAWQTGNFLGTSAQANVLDNVANFFRVTGVKLEAGTVASALDFVSFGEELSRCQRYYQKSFDYGTAPAQNAGTTGAPMAQQVGGAASFLAISIFPQQRFRTTPTITTYNPSAANAQIRNMAAGTDCTATTSNVANDRYFIIQGLTAAGSAAVQTNSVHWTADAEL